MLGLSSYEVRFEHVCMAPTGCPPRNITLRWAAFGECQEVKGRDLEISKRSAPIEIMDAGAGAGIITGIDAGPVSNTNEYVPVPSGVLIPDQGPLEAQRRALYTKLQQGWGTFQHRSMLTWVLLPESFSVVSA